MKQSELIITALLARGERDVTERSAQKFRKFTRTYGAIRLNGELRPVTAGGSFWFVSRNGSLRLGSTSSGSQRVKQEAKNALLQESRDVKNSRNTTRAEEKSPLESTSQSNLKENEMAVKKATKPAKKPTAPAKQKGPSSPTETPEHKAKVAKTLAKSVQSSRDEDQQRKPAAKPKHVTLADKVEKAGGKKVFRTREEARKNMAAPAVEARRKQDHSNRVAAALDNDLVRVDPKPSEVQDQLEKDVEVDPISAVKDAGLMEHVVGKGPYRILLPQDANAELTLAQRVAMARNIIDLHGKLPYIKTLELRKPDFYNAETQSQREPAAAEKAPSNKPATKPAAAATSSASTITDGVPLKKICADIDIDPKIARRILRAKGAKPGGRWEWPADQVEATKKIIKEEAKKLEAKE